MANIKSGQIVWQSAVRTRLELCETIHMKTDGTTNGIGKIIGIITDDSPIN